MVDYDELKRLAEWRDRLRADPGRAAHFGSPYADKPMQNGRTYWNIDLADDITTLLAENAALREQVKFEKQVAYDENDRWQEAERKLAEAEETSTRWAIRFAELRKAAGIGVKPMLSEVPGELRKMRSLLDRAAELMRQCTDPKRFEGASTLNVYANMRAWLSDLPPAPGAEA
ncbi:hypothetical protein [Brevundimonas diminuta]|uniref:hypothetical protein n=1 Tax=Brevundimonas diminuta TaxID=293 RepID=UPI0025A65239|nr:hypothetical protein [Brevundimonas diminuta]MDM8352849.1 hypothetical protein [Brevundimonas diminuta]